MVSKLGGLPDLSFGPTTVQPAPVVSSDAVTAAFSKLATQAEGLATAVSDKVFKPQAEQEGTDAVKRDPVTGTPTVKPPSFMTQITGQTNAYQHAVQTGLLSQAGLDATSAASDIAAKNAGNADGFRNDLDAYAGKYLQQIPGEFQPAVKQLIFEKGQTAFTGLVAQQAKNAVSGAMDATTGFIKQNSADLDTYAMQNRVEDPAAQAQIQQTLSAYKSMRDNPAFNYSDGQYQQDTHAFLSRIGALQAVGVALQSYGKKGKDGAISEMQRSLQAPELGLSAEQQQYYGGMAERKINEADADVRAKQAQARMQVQFSIADAKTAGRTGQSGGWRSIINEDDVKAGYSAPEAAKILADLDESDQQGSMTKQLALASPAEAAALRKQYSMPGAPGKPMLDEDGAQSILMSALPGAKVTSAARTPEHNAAVGGAPNSFHVKGQALDFTPPDGMSLAQAHDALAQTLSAQGLPPAELMIENAGDPHSTGPHIHWAWNGSDTHLASQQKLSSAFDTASKQRDAQIAADPVGYVLTQRPDISAGLSSLDPTTRQSSVRTLLALQDHIGVPPGQQKIYADNQVDHLADGLANGSPGTEANILRGTTQGLTPSQVRIVAQQIAPKNRAFAAAVTAAQSSPGLAATIIQGERYLLQNPDNRPTDKQAAPIVDGATAGSAGLFSSTGGLFQFAPDGRATAIAAANAIYAQGRIGKSSTFSSSDYRAALSQVTGPTFTFRGTQIIPPPRTGMDANSTEDLMRKVDAGAIQKYGNGQPVLANGTKVSAADIAQHGVLTWTGSPGLYRVRFPGQGHIGVTGNPNSKTFMINMGAMAGARQ